MLSSTFELWPHQVEGVSHVVKNRRSLIPLPGGTGKSYIPLGASKELEVKTITILCSSNALYTWVKNIQLHRPDLASELVVLEKLNVQSRLAYWNNPNIKVIIACARSFWRNYPDIEFAPGMLILDEPQKYMRKETSKTAQAIIEYAQNVPNVVITTGSPESKGRQDLYPILHMLRPKKYPSKWRFLNQYLMCHRGAFGMEFLGPRNTPQFLETTKTEIFRPSQPITGMPEIVRQTLPVEMQPKQSEFYKSIYEDMYVYLNSGDLLVTMGVLSKITRLRQILCCPKILDPSFPEYGAGIEATLDHMEEDDDRRHAVWGTPFTDAIPYMREALIARGFRKQVVFAHGMTSSQMKECEEYFRNNKDAVAIVSILFAQSFELETGNPAYAIGYSFDPEDNKQFEWRLRRITTQRAFVNAYYIHNLNTYDDRHLNVLSVKTLNTRVDMRSMHGIKEAFGF